MQNKAAHEPNNQPTCYTTNSDGCGCTRTLPLAFPETCQGGETVVAIRFSSPGPGLRCADSLQYVAPRKIRICTYNTETEKGTTVIRPLHACVYSVTLDDNLRRLLSPVQPFPLDDHVAVVVLPPGQPTVLREALDVRQHRGFVLGGTWDGADLFKELPEGLQRSR